MSTPPIRVTVWNEGRHEKNNPAVAAIYPRGIHGALADHLNVASRIAARTATLDDDHDHGLTDAVVDSTDVLLWWGHLHHDDVRDDVVARVHQRVLAGMGLVVLHSGHFSKIFKRLMGTTCDLKWRDAGERETLWVTRPGHPTVEGINDHFGLEHEEMYGEFFDVPEPECTFLISSFAGGEVFRSGMTWTRGAGRVVYFRPGHELFPTYHDSRVLRVIENAVRWANPTWANVAYGERAQGWIEQRRETGKPSS
ncbi:MAG TPA: ThuA domain-containing protein [Tepidisphaeraceae bacterium]|nr:ThuA domain-containing protein [Tepidisphaeraceae bacterium]